MAQNSLHRRISDSEMLFSSSDVAIRETERWSHCGSLQLFAQRESDAAVRRMLTLRCLSETVERDDRLTVISDDSAQLSRCQQGQGSG